MSLYTFKTLQDEVLAHQLSDSKYRPYVKTWLNEGQRYFVSQTDARTQEESESYTTVAGTATLTLPTDYSRLIDLRNTDTQTRLMPVRLRDFDEAPSSSGSPSGYVVIASAISLYPTPDAAYNLALRYWRLPATMSLDADTPEIPDQYQHILIRYALKRAYQRENDYEAAQYWNNELETAMLKARTELHHDAFEGPRQVPGTWDEGTLDPNVWY